MVNIRQKCQDKDSMRFFQKMLNKKHQISKQIIRSSKFRLKKKSEFYTKTIDSIGMNQFSKWARLNTKSIKMDTKTIKIIQNWYQTYTKLCKLLVSL